MVATGISSRVSRHQRLEHHMELSGMAKAEVISCPRCFRDMLRALGRGQIYNKPGRSATTPNALPKWD